MPFSPAPTPDRVPLLHCIGLTAFVAFPWCFVLVPLSLKFEAPIVFTLGNALQLMGLAYTAVFLNIFIHEGGHWFFGRIVGIRISRFVVGTGSAPLRFAWRGIAFSFGPWLRWGYVSEIPERRNLQFGKQFVFLTGGMIAEAVFIFALWSVPVSRHNTESFTYAWVILREFAFTTGVIGICMSAWPRMASVEGHGTPNDGLLIRQAWERRHRLDDVWRRTELSNEVVTLSEAGHYAEAAAIVERLLESDPKNTNQLAILASLHAAAENWDRAMLAHHAIIQQMPPNSLERVRAVDSAATLALQLRRKDDLVQLRPLVEHAMRTAALPTIMGTLGSILVELGETEAGVALLNRCVAESSEDHDRAIGNAYLAKAALQLGRRQRAAELLNLAQNKGTDHPLVAALVKELQPQLHDDVTAS